MNNSVSNIDFTGEFFVPGKAGTRLEEDHMERYQFASRFGQGKEILDIACGVGYSAAIFVKAGAKRYHGVDLNEQLIAHANQSYGNDRVSYSTGDICTYNGGTQYDVITCFETIEHVKEYKKAILNLYGLVKKNGILVISSPNRCITSPQALSLQDKPENKYHTQEFLIEELMECIHQAGFQATLQSIYGQRQRIVLKNKYFNKIIRMFQRNPNEKTSAKVTPVMWKVPRYFIIVANKV